MKFKFFSCIFSIVFTSILCYSQSDNVTSFEIKVNIEFSQSPIDLKDIDAKFAKDIAYNVYSETVFDVFLPISAGATGMVIYIHGGGFRGGDKSHNYKPDFEMEVRALLSNNIAVANINYRLLNENEETEGVLKSLKDVKRAIQYIRSIACDLNIEKERIALTGGSAGAGASLWIATNDDMRDESNGDPVLRESTRVKAIAIGQPQASYDIEDRWINNVFVDYGITFNDLLALDQDRLLQFYGVNTLEEYNTPEIDAYRNQVDMLSFITSDDPDIWAEGIKTDIAPPTNPNIAFHHPFHVREIKEKADSVGVLNICYYGKNPIIFRDPSNEKKLDFLIRKVNE
ncbi:MAG: para-nitrobenzyl esterase [Ulvibacter sp.]|jgi:para-nitrobenzyl esterase